MGSHPPISACSSASLLLPSLSPSVDNWFIDSTADHLLTRALTRELQSASASSSSCSGFSCDTSKASVHSKHSNEFFYPQTQSNASQIGSPFSSDSVSKDQPGSPFNHINSGSFPRIGNMAGMANQDITQQYHASQGGNKKAATLLQAPSVALSSQAAAGAGTTKVSKKRMRASKKAPIRVLSTDTSNFRAMVQQLTGIPAPQGLPSTWGSPCGVPLLKPQPTRISPLELPTLDTSSAFFAPKVDPFLQAEALAGLMASHRSNPNLDSCYHPSMISPYASTSAVDISTIWDLLASAKSDNSFSEGHPKPPLPADTGAVRPLPSSIDNFLMVDEDQYPKLPLNTVDSWLSFDGGAITNLSPKLDLAEIAS